MIKKIINLYYTYIQLLGHITPNRRNIPLKAGEIPNETVAFWERSAINTSPSIDEKVIYDITQIYLLLTISSLQQRQQQRS